MSDEDCPIIIAPLQIHTAKLYETTKSRKATPQAKAHAQKALERAKALIKDGEVEGTVNVQARDLKHAFIVRRKSTADLQDELRAVSPRLDDAWNEIGAAPAALKADAIGFRAMNWGRVGGMSGEELSAYMIDVKARYLKWTAHMTKSAQLSMFICQRVCQDAEALRKVRDDMGMGYERARGMLFHGLNQYSILAKWGDHLKEK